VAAHEGEGVSESSARDAILASVRENLRGVQRSRVERSGPPPGAPAGLDTPAERLARFVEVLEGVDGHCTVVRDEANAAAALRRIAADLGAREVAVSDAPLARAIAAGLGDAAVFDGWSDRERLLACDLGVTGAQWGIAETGTLVLDSEAERHRLVSLVPPVHVAILDTDRILGTLGDALATARGDDPDSLPRVLTFITGPSRTADIELTLVVGVHGPKELHVILLSKEAPA